MTNLLPQGDVIAEDVPLDTYMAQFAAHFCEWDSGKVIKLSPVNESHDLLTTFFRVLFMLYFGRVKIGKARTAPFVMRIGDSAREPDVQIILDDNPHKYTKTAMIGPSDICIEIVSPESVERDYETKYRLYETHGVREYWLIDPIREVAIFYRLGDDGIYIDSTAEVYTTPLLPHFALDVAVLWTDGIEDGDLIFALVNGWLAD